MKQKCVFLFDFTGNMARPWADAGYECIIVDIQHPVQPRDTGNIRRVRADLRYGWLPDFDRDEIAFVAAFPPCDHIAVSGARWFKGKGLRALSQSIDFFATAAEFCEWSGAPYIIENPVSVATSYWRKPDHSFHPWQYADIETGDNYTKNTCLWTGGGFVMPNGLTEPRGPVDDRIHKCPPSRDRANIRSATPMGFAKAVQVANDNRKYPATTSHLDLDPGGPKENCATMLPGLGD